MVCHCPLARMEPRAGPISMRSSGWPHRQGWGGGFFPRCLGLQGLKLRLRGLRQAAGASSLSRPSLPACHTACDTGPSPNSPPTSEEEGDSSARGPQGGRLVGVDDFPSRQAAMGGNLSPPGCPCSAVANWPLFLP